MQQVTADPTRRPHLARIAGDFPTALTTAQQLGWEGRHQRILGDLWWVQGDMDQAQAAYRAAREEAEQHAATGEQATCQAQLSLVTAFTDPAAADDELALAEQLLAGRDLTATTLTTRIAALVRDAGTPCIEQRADALRAEITAAGLTATTAPTLELALAFQHAVTGDNAQLEASAERLRALTAGGDYAYHLDIAASMADQEPTAWSGTAWLDSQDMVRTRRRRLVLDRRTTARRDGATR